MKIRNDFVSNSSSSSFVFFESFDMSEKENKKLSKILEKIEKEYPEVSISTDDCNPVTGDELYEEDNGEYRIIELDSDEFISEDDNFDEDKYNEAYDFITDILDSNDIEYDCN